MTCARFVVEHTQQKFLKRTLMGMIDTRSYVEAKYTARCLRVSRGTFYEMGSMFIKRCEIVGENAELNNKKKEQKRTKKNKEEPNGD